MTRPPDPNDDRWGRTERWRDRRVTPRQREYLEAITTLWRKNLRAPSIRELAAHLGGISGAGVLHMLQKLEERKLAYWGAGLTGTLQTTGFRRKHTRFGHLMFWD